MRLMEAVFLTVAKKKSSHKEENKMVSWLLAKERLLKVNELSTFKNFFHQCEIQKKILRNLLINLKSTGKKFMVMAHQQKEM